MGKVQKEKTIEEGFEQLNEILKKMENSDVSLEETFKLYNDGLTIVKELNGKISQVESELNIVNE